MYKSPIEMIVGQLKVEQDGEISKAVQQCGINVDEKELMRALQYDRNQYEQGYNDGWNAAKAALENGFEYDPNHPYIYYDWMEG